MPAFSRTGRRQPLGRSGTAQGGHSEHPSPDGSVSPHRRLGARKELESRWVAFYLGQRLDAAARVEASGYWVRLLCRILRE